MGLLACKGKARRFVLGTAKLIAGLGILSLISGVMALTQHQPYAVYYPLLLLGVISTLVMGFALPKLRKSYEEAELRKITSVDAV